LAHNRRVRDLWTNRDYMLLWAGQLVSTLGSAASAVVYPLLILAMTDSPEAAGIATALRALPYVLLSLPAGALVDRWDRRRVMICCDVGRGLATASIPIAVWLDALTVAQLYAATFIEGSLFVFFNVAEVAALPRVVPKHHLPQAAAQNDAAFAAVNIAAPSLGTVLYGTLGRAVPFVVDTLSYAASTISLLAIRTPFRVERTRSPGRLHEDVLEGVRWLWRDRLIRYMALVTGGLNLVNAGTPLTVIVLAKELGVPDASIGVAFTLGAVGCVIGALAGGRIQKRYRFGTVIVACIASYALLFPLYAIAPSLLALGLIGAGIFFASPVYNVVQFSYRVSVIPDELQGRVNSTFRLFAFGFMPLGAALAGYLIESFGPRVCVLVLDAVLVGLAALTAINPHVRAARGIEHPGEAGTPVARV
jgi:MFS family permease